MGSIDICLVIHSDGIQNTWGSLCRGTGQQGEETLCLSHSGQNRLHRAAITASVSQDQLPLVHDIQLGFL